eukprot:9369561-Pyramimonas_sp.AAC.1
MRVRQKLIESVGAPLRWPLWRRSGKALAAWERCVEEMADMADKPVKAAPNNGPCKAPAKKARTGLGEASGGAPRTQQERP